MTGPMAQCIVPGIWCFSKFGASPKQIFVKENKDGYPSLSWDV